MKFIRMKDGTDYRSLEEYERDALRARFSHKGTSKEKQNIAARLLHDMKSYNLWLKCDCKDKDAPIMIARKRKNGIVLANKRKGGLHAEDCVMERAILPDENEADGVNTSRKPLVKATYSSIIPRTEGNTTSRTEGSGRGQNNSRKRYSGIARLMLTLIEDAKLNTLKLPLEPLAKSEMGTPDSLEQWITDTDYYPGRKLHEVIRLDPRQDPDEREKIMAELEAMHWRKGEAPTFWVMFRSTDVRSTGAYYTFNNFEYRFEPTKGMSINGEHADGGRECYWVIARFVRDIHTRQVVCRECYAHAIYSMTIPVPIDSNLERKTLTSISDMVKWINGKTQKEIHLLKPVFDIKIRLNDEDEFVLPDFILTISSGSEKQHKLVVETCGYTTEEYIERKLEQHELMKQLGELITDPPDWPCTSNKSFTKVLGRYLFHPEERGQ